MGISIPFDLSAASVPLVENYNDIPLGPGTQLPVYVTDCLPTDDLTSMTFIAKVNVADSNIAESTILKTITTTPTVDGVLARTGDLSVWLGLFSFSAHESVRLARVLRYYSITATVLRASVDYTRVVQKGVIQAQEGAYDVDSPYANGVWFADGELFANGTEA